MAFLGVSLTTLGTGCSADAGAPNFVFILADDLGWNDVGYNGSEIQTPHLDRLARDGVRFEQHYVHPVCSPTRAALLTGRYASRFGILGAIAGNSTQFLPPEIPTLPGILAENGYQTHISGKWHLALSAEYGPTRYGFQTSYGYLHGQIDPYTHLYKFGDRTWHRDDQLIEEQGHVTDLITDDAVRFVLSAGEDPFFLYVAYSVPHYPLAEAEEWTARYQDKIKERSRRLYAASTTHMDDGIGRLVKALEEAGVAERTLVVFSSDNGGQDNWLDTEGVYEGTYPPDPVLGNNSPLRGWKGDLYEGGIRVPAVAFWPGKLKPGSFVGPAAIVDWLPTLAALARCEDQLSHNLDGRNLWPVLSRSSQDTDRPPIYIKASSGAMLRSGDWKLIEFPGGQPALYNLREDPYEQTDLARKNPEPLEHLKKLLEEARGQDREPSHWQAP
jgi:arylsulfatase A-like enzyme